MTKIEATIRQVSVGSIKVSADRQRKEFKGIEALAESIKRHGQLQPIGIDKNGVLSWGQRRLMAVKFLKHDFIDCVYVEELSPGDLKAIEFEENFYREGLSWQEEALAIYDFHKLKMKKIAGWNRELTGQALGLTDRRVSDYISVSEAMLDPQTGTEISSCPTMGAAENMLDRRRARAQDREMDALHDAIDDLDLDVDDEEVTQYDENGDAPSEDEIAAITRAPSASTRPASRDVFQADFCTWAPKWDGPRFSFIHCDFPYGIEHGRSVQGASTRYAGNYEDSADTYWRLLDALLENKERLLTDNAHILFWLSLNTLHDTTKAFERNGFEVDPYPLIWFKSDNTSILPDSNRGARRAYEAALFIKRGDPKVVRAVMNLVAWPAQKDKAKHLSEKPEPVLAHFFRMFVDQHTIFLDPACGSGSSLRVAQGRWALRVMGMDLNPECVETAAAGLNSMRLAMAGRTQQESEESDEIDDSLEVE